MIPLAIGLGCVLLGLGVWGLCEGVAPKGRINWDSVDRMSSSLDKVGFGGHYVTRGFFVNALGLGVLGLFALSAGVAAATENEAASWLSIAFLFGFGLISLVAVVVARTGRPARWIPPRYRTATPQD